MGLATLFPGRGLTRSWSNAGNAATGYNGSDVAVSQRPHLRRDGGGTLDEYANGYTTRFFDLISGSLVITAGRRIDGWA